MWIHGTPVRYHGFLTGTKCLIDQTFTLKIAKVGYPRMQQIIGLETDELRILEQAGPRSLLWVAPEVLRRETSLGSPSDIYAAAVIINEICSQSLPYHNMKDLSHVGMFRVIRLEQLYEESERKSLRCGSALSASNECLSDPTKCNVPSRITSVWCSIPTRIF